MARARFHTLDPERRECLLSAAAQEFAERGFAGASVNRIIAASGTSKGQLYYYFSDKADLYATVCTHVLGRAFTAMGPPPEVSDSEAFWLSVRSLCETGMAFYDSDPSVPGLVRSLATEVPSQAAVQQIRALSAAWLGDLVSVGQRVGAVRADLPQGLVLALTAAVSECIDIWYAAHHHELDTERSLLLDQLVDIYRRLGAPTWEGA